MTSQPSKGTELFHKAEQAFTSRNFEYAKVLYHSFLEITPGHHEARYKLHTAALRCGAGTVVALRPWSLIGAGIAYLKATWYTTRNQWARAVAAWEGCLLVFPRAAFLHLKNASCLSRLGWTQAEIDEYKILRTLLPRDIAPLRELGRLYYEENRLAEAREAYEALLKIQPRDPKAPSELRKIDAQMTIDKGGWQQSGTYRDKIRDEDQATLAEQKSRLVRSKADIDAMLNSLQGQRIQNPKDIGVLREIAKLHSMGGNVEKAKEILREALEIAPRDFYLTQAYGELELAELQQELKKLRDHATQRPQDPKLGLALEKGLQAHRATLLKIKQAQVRQYPTNLFMRFDLGELYLQQGLLDEAVGEFQQAVKNPSKRLETQKYLGECFKRKRLFDLAVEQLKKASGGIPQMSALKKDILYELASVYEEMGKTAEAQREFEKIYTVDIAYKDVASKIER